MNQAGKHLRIDASDRDGHEGLGRDVGPISSRSSSKGALIAEAHAVFRVMASGSTVDEIRGACLSGQLFRRLAAETRHRIWEAIRWRFLAWAPPAWVLRDLMDASQEGMSSPRFVGLVYLHTARRDRLTFEFVNEFLWPHWTSGHRDVDRADVIDFFAALPAARQVRWRESTKVKVAGNVLSALRDFGLLTGVQRKKLTPPSVLPDVVLHLCRLLSAEGIRGRALLESPDWHLFLWDTRRTSEELARLAQLGGIRFERSGRTVILDVLNHPETVKP